MFTVFAKAEERKALEQAWADWPEQAECIVFREEDQPPAAGTMMLEARNGLLYPRPDWTLHTPPFLFWKEALTPAEVRACCQPPDTPVDEPAIGFIRYAWRHMTSDAPMPRHLPEAVMEVALASDDPFYRHALMHNLYVLLFLTPDTLQEAFVEKLQSTWNPHSEDDHLPPERTHLLDLLLCDWLMAQNDRVTAHHLLHERVLPAMTRLPKEGALMAVVLDLELSWPELIDSDDEDEREQYKQGLWQIIELLEDMPQFRLKRAALFEIATRFALFDGSFSEALGYANKAMALAEELAVPDLVQRMLLLKGEVLLSWAHAGDQPQFYDQALKVFQQLARSVDAEANPELYAVVQEYIGTIFVHKPVEEKKRGIMAGMAEAAFQEAVQVAKNNGLEHLYARICNNYANALQSFPDSRFTDKYEKALYYYQEALDRRPADQFPTERAFTQANYLQAALHLPQLDEPMVRDLKRRAEEVIELSPNAELRAMAEDILGLLEHLLESEFFSKK